MENFHNSKLWKSADLLESEKLEKGIQDCVMEIIKKRENKVVSGEADSFGDDYLGLLVNAYHDLNDKNKLSLEDLVVLHLAIHGDWQEKARGEVIDIFGNQNPHLEGITKLKTMSMIINETLRLYGINGLPREVAREVQLGKLVLPVNIDILVLNSGLHRDPYLWDDDAYLFKPERFSEEIAEATNYNATTFSPFELGPRSCVDMTFAMIETKIVLSMILERYTITLSPAYVHSPIPIISLVPQHGIQVILGSLHNNACST
ncbi:cytochrome P450 CYP749A22-like protein [Gossypium australe]|uniref:Cytochrome P450 CYP749A22-like protein n=1 Tax=Gossypium australe TaxID=47621 RepID=A0A5B6WXN7_9ROSI|nr:cytochrome P450 CYP749A22-like protein [Gossypium australe]